ncbi:MAG TPA: hypothetical protein VGG09_05455 [Acidimicrobiales bacterium]|jgi:hypothetical protein
MSVGAGAGALLLAAALGVAGVGGGPVAGASERSSSSSSSQLAQAKKALLVRSDFPSGWSAHGSTTTSAGGGTSSFPGGSQLASCLGVSQSLIDINTPSANSPTFETKGGVDTVQDSASVFSSTKQADQEYGAISSPKVPGCMTTVLQGPARQEIVNSLGKGITVGTITVAAVPGSALAAHTSGFTMSFPATDSGVTLHAAITFISMMRGTMASQLTIESVGKAFPVSLQRHLVSVAYGRT